MLALCAHFALALLARASFGVCAQCAGCDDRDVVPRGGADSAPCRLWFPVVLVQEHYPELMKDVKIRIIELMDHVLSTYDRKISEYTAKRFARAGMLTQPELLESSLCIRG